MPVIPTMNSVYWWIGEGLEWIHLPYVFAVAVLGPLWIRPLWLWLAHNIGMTSLQIACYGNCPLMVLAHWLKGDDYKAGWVSSIYAAYGPVGLGIAILALSVVGVLLAFALRRLFSPARIEWLRPRWHRKDSG